MVEFLLKQDADVAHKDHNGFNALQLALFRSYSCDLSVSYKMVSLLQMHGAFFEASIYEQAY